MSTIKEGLGAAMEIEGAMAASLIDIQSGMHLGSAGEGFDAALAGAGESDVLRAELRAMQSVGLADRIDDVMVALGGQYHLSHMVGSKLFLYLALDRADANLALARHKLGEIAREIRI
jgi:hypothetical protein